MAPYIGYDITDDQFGLAEIALSRMSMTSGFGMYGIGAVMAVAWMEPAATHHKDFLCVYSMPTWQVLSLDLLRNIGGIGVKL